MNLLEYQAKSLLQEAGAPIPASWLVTRSVVPSGVVYPVIAKSQVPVGGRGKAGGIVLIDDSTATDATVATLFELAIKGYVPRSILLEEALSIRDEFYLSLRLNRDERRIEYLYSKQGGVDVESNTTSVHAIPITEPSRHNTIATAFGLPLGELTSLLDALELCFKNNDLTLLEINPLVLTDDGSLLCADAKVIVDDNARFRRPELPWKKATGNKPVSLGGTIGCIANGAGMAMSTMDTIVAMGGKPANFLDIGGGTGEKEFVSALQSIIELPGVTSVIINIFAGISRCDEIAHGIIAAQRQIDNLPPLFIRLEGTNRDIAVRLLDEAGISIEPDLQTCVRKALMVVA
jgi:succinyl-CoA synthetase beta subunit